MDVTPLIDSDVNVIESVSAESISIQGQDYKQSIIVFKDDVVEVDIKKTSDLDEGSLKPVLDRAQDLDLVIIGTGDAHEFVPPYVRGLFTSQTIGVEFMDTAAACRTYNVLLADGRRIAAILIQ